MTKSIFLSLALLFVFNINASSLSNVSTYQDNDDCI